MPTATPLPCSGPTRYLGSVGMTAPIEVK